MRLWKSCWARSPFWGLCRNSNSFLTSGERGEKCWRVDVQLVLVEGKGPGVKQWERHFFPQSNLQAENLEWMSSPWNAE